MANVTLTNITPPRVPLTDQRTGLISREWYRFFLNLFELTGGGQNTTSLTDLQVGPPFPTQEDITDINVNIESLEKQPTEQSALDQIAELEKQIQGLETQVCCQVNEVFELQKQIQALQLQRQPELGTLSQIQQDNVPWLQFDTTPTGYPTGVLAHGTLYWDNEDRSKTLALVMEDTGNVIQDIGEETYYRVKASSAITKGQVVMFTGTVGASGGLLAAPATGLTAFQNEYILGIATQNIALNGWGYVTWFGEVDKVNTTGGAEAWVDGQILYYNPAVTGGLTKNVPAAPNPKVIVASVVHAATNGILFVRPTFGSALGATDSNVEITGLANGDLLQYDGIQQRWENKSIADVKKSFGPGPKSLSIFNPGPSENVTLFFTSVELKLSRIRSVLIGTSPSVTYSVKSGTDRSVATTTNVNNETVTSVTTGTDATILSLTIAANSWIWIETSAISGTVTFFSINLEF